MEMEFKNRIFILDKEIRKLKIIRDAYSFFRIKDKVKQNEKLIYDLETRLIKEKLKRIK